MKQNREDIPFEYAHCFATDGQCPQRSGCLHALITELPMKTSQYASNIITAIDPRYIASLHGKGGCTFYRSSDLKRYACGMSRMFDAVPSRIVSEVRVDIPDIIAVLIFPYLAERHTTALESRMVLAGEDVTGKTTGLYLDTADLF